ncbi:MAG TPA: hypothetical protein VFK27_07800, partial [Bacillales bacterium]|nr:hypothetical protein [Bacillales bacterium]
FRVCENLTISEATVELLDLAIEENEIRLKVQPIGPNGRITFNPDSPWKPVIKSELNPITELTNVTLWR